MPVPVLAPARTLSPRLRRLLLLRVHVLPPLTPALVARVGLVLGERDSLGEHAGPRLALDGAAAEVAHLLDAGREALHARSGPPAAAVLREERLGAQKRVVGRERGAVGLEGGHGRVELVRERRERRLGVGEEAVEGLGDGPKGRLGLGVEGEGRQNAVDHALDLRRRGRVGDEVGEGREELLRGDLLCGHRHRVSLARRRRRRESEKRRTLEAVVRVAPEQAREVDGALLRMRRRVLELGDEGLDRVLARARAGRQVVAEGEEVGPVEGGHGDGPADGVADVLDPGWTREPATAALRRHKALPALRLSVLLPLARVLSRGEMRWGAGRRVGGGGVLAVAGRGAGRRRSLAALVLLEEPLHWAGGEGGVRGGGGAGGRWTWAVGEGCAGVCAERGVECCWCSDSEREVLRDGRRERWLEPRRGRSTSASALRRSAARGCAAFRSSFLHSAA